MFRKVPKEITEATAYGGLISITGAVIMVILNVILGTIQTWLEGLEAIVRSTGVHLRHELLQDTFTVARDALSYGVVVAVSVASPLCGL